MVIYSFDPRTDIRKAICTRRDIWDENIDRYCLSTVTDNMGDTVYLPLLLPSEVRTGEFAPMPYIEMIMITNPSDTHDIGGATKHDEAFMGFNLWIADEDNITPESFAKATGDSLASFILYHRSSTASSYHVETRTGMREREIEMIGKRPVFHYEMEVYANNYVQR